jgi:hypothetical protein
VQLKRRLISNADNRNFPERFLLVHAPKAIAFVALSVRVFGLVHRKFRAGLDHRSARLSGTSGIGIGP